RYSEQRENTTEPLKAPRDPGQETGSGGWTAVKQQGAWASTAALRDAPGHKMLPTDILTGDEHFEVAAMADGQKFLGSVRWGYRIDDTAQTLNLGGQPVQVACQSVLDPNGIVEVSHGAASDDFLTASKKWNEMPVPDPINP